MPLEPRREALPLLPCLALGDNDLVHLALGTGAGRESAATPAQKLEEALDDGLNSREVGVPPSYRETS